jgi:POT family proton-dependent oligopeptide transporter
VSSRSTDRLFLLSLAVALERTAAGLVAAHGIFFLTEVLRVSAERALSTLGAFQALTYLAGIAGGTIADRLLGRLPAILSGLAALALGYLVLAAAPGEQLLLGGLLLIAGHGLFKPSVAAEVGRVGTGLPAEQWYYFAANVGLALGPLLGSLARGVHGWPAAFVLSAGAAGSALPVLLRYRSLAVAVTAGQSEDSNDGKAQHPRKTGGGSILALSFLLVAVVVHGVAYHQVGGSLLLYASESRAQTLFGHALSPSVFGSLPAVFTLLLMPPLAGACRRYPGLLSPKRQLLFGSAATAVGFAVLLVGDVLGGAADCSPLALASALLVITLGEVLLLPTSLQLAVTALPPAHRSLAAALWCVAVAAGQWLAGLAGGVFSEWPHTEFFALHVLVALLSGLVFSLVQTGKQTFSFTSLCT